MKSFVTKGDANDTEDMVPVEYERLIGVVEKTIPKAGQILTVFTEIRGKILAAGMLVVSVLLNAIAGAISEKRE